LSLMAAFITNPQPMPGQTEFHMSSKPTPDNAQASDRQFTHIDAQGQVRMVDVGSKPVCHRQAIAEGFFCAAPATLDRLLAGELPKGEALAAARIAGILAAKNCDSLIPLCHSLPLDAINIGFTRASAERVRIEATARITAKTGVEMEALTAVAVAALTLYDMTKAIDKAIAIDGIRLVSKVKSQGR
jgi:cyclic pyranopterin phosphate synthase